MRAFLLITVATVLHSCLAAQPEVFGYSQASIRAAKAKLTADSGVVTPLHEGNGTGKLYLFNNSVVVPGSPALLEFDLSTKKYSVVKELPPQYAIYDVVSGSVVCGDTYYAVYTQYPAAAGVLKIDLKTKKFDYMGTGSQPGQTKAGMYLVTLDTASGNSTIIGEFPTMGASFTGFVGFDGPLKFTPDGKEAWVAWAGAFPPKVKTGELLIMDTSTGKIKEKHTIPTKYGAPYEIYPTGADSFRVAFAEHWNTPKFEVNLCTATKSSSSGRRLLGGGKGGSSLTISSCTNVAAYKHSGSAPNPVCGDKIIAVGVAARYAGESQPLNEIDLATGKSTEITDLQNVIPGTEIGAVACAA